MKYPLKRISIKFIMCLGPCDQGIGERHHPVQLRKLFGDKPSITTLELAELRIPLEDRLWVLNRTEVLGDEIHSALWYTRLERYPQMAIVRGEQRWLFNRIKELIT